CPATAMDEHVLTAESGENIGSMLRRAEDILLARLGTGVQTPALPTSRGDHGAQPRMIAATASSHDRSGRAASIDRTRSPRSAGKSGRASCRDRVERAGINASSERYSSVTHRAWVGNASSSRKKLRYAS